MSLLLPLGLLGLIGLAVLLLIYLLKPNYQQKVLSSTFVWRLSLKYKRRRNPISRLRNLLILLCQILIISACAFAMAQPAIAVETTATSNEKIVIIDASASMLASHNGETRFERAVRQSSEYVGDMLAAGNTVTVILAGRQAEYLAFRINSESDDAFTIASDLDALIADPLDLKCSYGAGDIEGAKNLAEEITIENPLAEIFMFTGTTYLDTGNITVVDVSTSDEWNVAILNSYAELYEGYYNFNVEVASYGIAQEFTVVCEVSGINVDPSHPDGLSDRYTIRVQLPKDNTTIITFDPGIMNKMRVYSFKSARVFVEVDDSFQYDNIFDIFGGTREEIKIQYYSIRPNPFFQFVLLSTVDAFRDSWDITVTEVPLGRQPAIEGFDIYIFEHIVPMVLPTDGVVMLADPDRIPAEINMLIDSRPTTTADNMFRFTEGDVHPITEHVNVESFGVTEYARIIEWDRNIFTPLMYCNGDPVLLCENNPDSKIIIMAFSVNMSTPSTFDFGALMHGIYDYYIPSTTDSYVYDVNSEISLRSRSNKLEVSDQAGGEPIVFEEFPATLLLDRSGSYVIRQTLMSGKKVSESIFVRVPNDESNIVKEVQVLPSPVKRDVTENVNDMFALYIILGVAVALLFIEWLLHAYTGA